MKRFSETSKWEDDWFVSLPPIQKLVFLFMVDKCDNAGFFEPSPAIHSMMLGVRKEEFLGAIEGLKRGYLAPNENSGCNRIFLCSFLRHQKNLPLNPDNNAHKQIIEIISRYISKFNSSELCEKLGANLGLFSPIGIGKVKVEEKKIGVGQENTDSDLVKFAVGLLNEKSESGFKFDGKKTIAAISARVKEGATKEDFGAVILDRVAAWKGDKKMDEFLRPETLFGTKFEGYLQAAKKQVSSDPPTKYQILLAKGWKNCTQEEVVWAYDYQHRTPMTYLEYPRTELLGQKGYAKTAAEYDAA